MAVVLAAHGLSRALVTRPYPNNGDRGAVESDQNVQVPKDDAEKPQNAARGRVTGLSQCMHLLA